MKLLSDLRAFFKEKKILDDNRTEAINFRRKILLSSLKKDHTTKEALKIYNRLIVSEKEYQVIN